ncbi:hypothetical protein [Rufibacter roseus]|uniref:Uncharacterized protein n=1 Tax=Rufibacter roseus TaxID=1567108 RepID=A0ABW2DHL6_9BACT|nr:hypothetical protein [Rufibacter roseus]
MKKIILRSVIGLIFLLGVAAFFFADQQSGFHAQEATFVRDNSVTQGAPDSVIVSAGAHYIRGGLGEFFLGKHYRRVWGQPVKAKVFHMGDQRGGLRIEKLGGGMQTTSLTLTDSMGRRFALRSVDKDPIQVLPPFWRNTVLGSFVRDQISATNPYGALAVAPLASAANVLHPTPQLVFVMPNDNDFKQYSTLFGSKLFLMEEKFSNKSSLSRQFGNAVDLLDTEEMLVRRYKSNRHRIDQWAYARARLLDFLISDWDRHEGQWDWAEYRHQGETWYKPVPKDRDQAFGRYDDGLIPWLATRKFAARKFSSFHPEFKDVYGLTINASFLDARALSEVTQADFKRLARELQNKLNDSVLRAAVRQFPAEVYELIGEETYQVLKKRLQLLPQAAEKYYDILAEEVAVVGTDEAERFVVHRLSQGRTVVEVFRLSASNTNGAKVYARTFFANETKRINLYGLGGNDLFDLKGYALQGSYVTIYAGDGQNKVTDESEVDGWRNKTVVKGHVNGVEIKPGPETEISLKENAAEVPTFIRVRQRD